MADFVAKDHKCFGPLCNHDIDLKRPWSKFHSTRCKTNYHIVKNTLKMILSLLTKPAALDMLDNLRRRIENKEA